MVLKNCLRRSKSTRQTEKMPHAAFPPTQPTPPRKKSPQWTRFGCVTVDLVAKKRCCISFPNSGGLRRPFSCSFPSQWTQGLRVCNQMTYMVRISTDQCGKGDRDKHSLRSKRKVIPIAQLLVYQSFVIPMPLYAGHQNIHACASCG